MKTANELPADTGLTRSFWAVGVFGAVLSAGTALLTGDLRESFSAVAGVSIALLNLWMTAYLVRGFVDPLGIRLPWSVIAVVKLLLLLGLTYVLLRRGVLSLLPMAVGFGALPLGIVFGQTRGRSVKEELHDA